MFLTRLQLEKVDHVDETDLQVGELLPQQHCSCQGLLRGDIAGGCHNQVGLAALIATCPVPNTDALRTVLDSGVHVQVLEVQLLVGNDHINVVLAPESVIRYRQQTFRVGRQVNACRGGALIQNNVEETRILVRESVVVLPPNRGGDQEVQRRDIAPPREMVAD